MNTTHFRHTRFQVRPIFKKGNKTSPNNYRPVSLTSIVCKIFESFIRNALYDHLVKNNLLSNHQFGFCKGRSCISQLLVTIEKWMSCMDNNVPTDAIYLDFSKAFERFHIRGLFTNSKVMVYVVMF